MKNLSAACLLLIVSAAFLPAETSAPLTVNPGAGANIEITTGLMGSLSFAQAGFNLPQFIKNFSIGAKFRALSSLTWATFINMETGESVSFHPVTVGGVLTLGGTSPVIRELFRPYGYFETLLGYSFTPWDDLIYGTGNLIGPNFTFGVFGVFGLEFFTGRHMSVIVESGGGFKSLKVPEENAYAVASSWLGSGVTFRMGMRIYP
ncbi:MAG: hypothetical protein E4H36_14455 [Spirochaetales bacterium]|nr:MAG: hypothetical protein E4H36_14455 [Spirochaetales bacterium]